MPYPNTSHCRDMKAGSKRVKIGGKPVMLADQSYYATSPLGNEAATKSFGGSIVTHTITGKTYFGAWSTDVKFEGKGVCRHLDLTTSNHASYPGSTPPWLNAATLNMVKVAEAAIAKGRCACCGGDKHSTAAPMGRDEWYEDNIDKKAQTGGWTKAQLRAEKRAYRALIKDAMARAGCTCEKRTRLLPNPPCDVFYGRQPDRSPQRKEQKKKIHAAWRAFRLRFQFQQGLPEVGAHRSQLERQLGRPVTEFEFNEARKTNHLTPKSAGGCPTGAGNLQLHAALCPPCQALDDRFKRFQ
ncbi:hypothetical protein ENSA5_44660 [Enhygromyxa salina]|uniref:Uncharacterized protein n=2 Tax=Enhygromyxa salina TaxID=215803 RepID=A0A2S9XJY6_9BACT|nr:hypothetical protein ENSA5_44660 [Enhygromyxa salina]